MPTAFYLMLASALILIALFFFFKAETIRGKRFILDSFRERLDMNLSLYFRDKHQWRKHLGASSLRLFLHFILHHVISGTLFVIKSIEARLKKLKRHNRLVAKNITSNGNSHLRSIAKHKEDVALSPEERAARNERSLND